MSNVDQQGTEPIGVAAGTNAYWYLVQCKAREAFRAHEHLTNQQFECFLPTHSVKRTRRQTTRWVTEPLFPHYLFIRLHDTSNWGVIRSTRGVAKVVGFNGRPCPVAAPLVAALQHQCAIRNGEQPPPLYQPGEKVLLTEGCFKDLEAVVQATKSEERVVLLLTLLNREQTIEVPINTVRGA